MAALHTTGQGNASRSDRLSLRKAGDGGAERREAWPPLALPQRPPQVSPRRRFALVWQRRQVWQLAQAWPPQVVWRLPAAPVRPLPSQGGPVPASA